jgi:UPF0755 protein
LRYLILILVFLLAAGWLLKLDIERALHGPLLLDSDEVLVLERGTGWNQVVAEMQARNWLRHERDALYLRALARIDPRTNRIRAGEYMAAAGGSPLRLLERLAAGEVIQYELTLVEGWRFSQAMAAIRAHPKLRQTLPADADGAAVMAAIGAEARHPEGRLLPETYRFPAGTTDVAFLRRAYEALQREVASVWESRRDGLPYQSPEDMLIMASIIERETGAPHERTKVAGVFVRRLGIGMRLQTDPTVMYGVAEDFTGRLRTIHLRTDTPYNTYTRAGLPPTPICLPGRASLRAAVEPADGDALYFVSRNDGTHHFSATLQEHNAAVRRYQLGER